MIENGKTSEVIFIEPSHPILQDTRNSVSQTTAPLTMKQLTTQQIKRCLCNKEPSNDKYHVVAVGERFDNVCNNWKDVLPALDQSEII